ncbi:acetyl-CoA C-acyltransferase [Faunimonas sp. B44]|uniref:acetyl-CoA C-acyltransferase n=1 Tax=Faunimonas sp. B44 TaxID=3461493 RepID=UPI0040449804
MLEAYIYDGIRTPFGKRAGALASIRPDDLLAHAMRSLLDRSAFSAEDLEDVIVGCGNQAGEDSRCVARHAALLAGIPVGIGGAVVQRNCGSGLGAIVAASHAVTCGEGDLFISGGVESMSRAPFVMAKADAAFSRNVEIFDSTVGARFPNPAIEAQFGADTLTETSDNLAREYEIDRAACDRFAAASQAKCEAARQDGFFAGEIVPVVTRDRKGDRAVESDEFPRPGTDEEALARLRPLNPDGVTTAGNSSGINDGAAALLVGSRAAGAAAGAAPIARVLASATAGVPPRIMGIGPVPASQKALARAGLSLAEIDVIEINEAFAAQVCACLKGLGLALDDSRVNPNGGAIAIGHPLGASGARLALTAARQLQRSEGRYALVTMCIGVGQGIAVVLDRC